MELTPTSQKLQLTPQATIKNQPRMIHMPLLIKVMIHRVIIHMVAKRVFMVILRQVQGNHMARAQNTLRELTLLENLQKVQERAEVIVMDQSRVELMTTDPIQRNQSRPDPIQNTNL